jgi:hypothetical protein
MLAKNGFIYQSQWRHKVENNFEKFAALQLLALGGELLLCEVPRLAFGAQSGFQVNS